MLETTAAPRAPTKSCSLHHGGPAVMTWCGLRQHALLELLAEEAFRSEQQHDDEDQEGERVLELDRQAGAGQALGHAEGLRALALRA